MEYDFSDYQKIYDLTLSDLSKPILDFSDGASHFPAKKGTQAIRVTMGTVSQLPHLPYKTHQFDLVLCTDFIFHHALSHEKITEIVKELCRVAEEVRIFPLLNHQGKMSDALGPLMLMLQKKNYGVEVRQVPYQSGNAMLRIWGVECEVSV